HFVTPAMHLPKNDILNFFDTKDVNQLASQLRSEIREYASKAVAGVTGANSISADGYVLLIENEGNISLASTLPPIHIVIAGWDKVVSSLEDALLVARAQSLWSTGADPAYLHLISQPSGTVDIGGIKVRGMHGAKEIHLILVDNGRSRLLETDLREVLKCIGCGACLYVCPVYRTLLSEFGGELPSFRGLIHTYLSGDLQKLIDNGLFKCTGCNLCQEVCPVNINLKVIFWSLRSICFKNGYLDEVGRDLMEKINRFGNAVGEVKRGERPTLHCC
ncbi:MAG TPA: lactate utilization protein, partial [Candidatus Bathyarchaeota archaeon]|nr:lactate utilization protein [Candidatus Bathyarchaeota archaeon]